MFTAEEARDIVMLEHERVKAGYLYAARAIAKRICENVGEVTINDIRDQLPPPASMHPSVLGAVFRNKQFKHTGRYVTAKHVASHARRVGVYTIRSIT
jgi:hypothetical protein